MQWKWRNLNPQPLDYNQSAKNLVVRGIQIYPDGELSRYIEHSVCN